MSASCGLSANEDQLRRMSGVASSVRQSDRAAEGHAQDDRLGDAQDLAERAHVIAPLRQGPSLLRPGLAAAIPSMVEIDDLRDIRQGRECRLVDRMVEAGASMEEK